MQVVWICILMMHSLKRQRCLRNCSAASLSPSNRNCHLSKYQRRLWQVHPKSCNLLSPTNWGGIFIIQLQLYWHWNTLGKGITSYFADYSDFILKDVIMAKPQCRKTRKNWNTVSRMFKNARVKNYSATVGKINLFLRQINIVNQWRVRNVTFLQWVCDLNL